MAVICKFPRRRNKQIPAWIGFQATAGDNTLHLRPQTAGFDCTIDWGDGSKTVAPVNGGKVIHSYANARLYDIKISGKSFAGFYVANQAGKEKYVAAYCLGQWAVDTMNTCGGSFQGCNNLVIISADLFRYNTTVSNFEICFTDCVSLTTIPVDLFGCNILATSFYSCFNTCRNLTIIPKDIFKYNLEVKEFYGCFAECNNLAVIPIDIFKYNINATGFKFCFSGCIKLTLRSDMFGTDYANRFNGKTVDFTTCFRRYGFTGTQGTAPALWNFTGLTATKTNCFGGDGNNSNSISNYGSIPLEWGRQIGGP